MTDPADRFLEERLHALARGVRVPIVPAEDDVRRGRRRLVRMRVAMGGATIGTLAVVLGITSLTAGDPKATEPPPVTQPPTWPTTTLPATPSSTPSEESSDDTAVGGQQGGQGGSARVGAASVDDPSSEDTNAADRGGPTSGLPVKNAPIDAASSDPTHGSTTGHHHPGGGSPTSDPTEAPTATPTSTPTDPPTSTPTTTPTSDPTETPTSTPTVPPTGSTRIRVHQVLRYYNDVLAEHLDPGRTYLQPYDRTIDTKETRTGNGHLYALGSTYRWEDGRSLSGLEITVASGWDQVDWDCGASYSDWSCHSGASDDTEIARHDGVLQVAVEHPSGQVVVLTADPTYAVGRRSAGDVDGSEAGLAAAAADDRLILPGAAPVAPPRLDASSFAAAGVTALVKPGETFQQNGIDRAPWVRGAWSSSTQHGTLSWTVQPIYSGGSFTCLTSYRSCSEVSVDGNGTTVHLALLKPKAGGGWLVQYDGGAYAVRVYSSNRAFPKKGAYVFVTQPGWQPGR